MNINTIEPASLLPCKTQRDWNAPYDFNVMKGARDCGKCARNALLSMRRDILIALNSLSLEVAGVLIIIITLIVTSSWGFSGTIYKLFTIYKSKNDNKTRNHNLWWYSTKLNSRAYEGNVCLNSVPFRARLKDANEALCLSSWCKLFHMLAPL